MSDHAGSHAKLIDRECWEFADSHDATTALTIALARHVTLWAATQQMRLAFAPRAHALLLVTATTS